MNLLTELFFCVLIINNINFSECRSNQLAASFTFVTMLLFHSCVHYMIMLYKLYNNVIKHTPL